MSNENRHAAMPDRERTGRVRWVELVMGAHAVCVELDGLCTVKRGDRVTLRADDGAGSGNHQIDDCLKTIDRQNAELDALRARLRENREHDDALNALLMGDCLKELRPQSHGWPGRHRIEVAIEAINLYRARLREVEKERDAAAVALHDCYEACRWAVNYGAYNRVSPDGVAMFRATIERTKDSELAVKAVERVRESLRRPDPAP